MVSIFNMFNKELAYQTFKPNVTYENLKYNVLNYDEYVSVLIKIQEYYYSNNGALIDILSVDESIHLANIVAKIINFGSKKELWSYKYFQCYFCDVGEDRDKNLPEYDPKISYVDYVSFLISAPNFKKFNGYKLINVLLIYMRDWAPKKNIREIVELCNCGKLIFQKFLFKIP